MEKGAYLLLLAGTAALLTFVGVNLSKDQEDPGDKDLFDF